MRRNQSGIFLVSAAVAIAVVGMLITFWGVNQMRQMQVERAERVGHGLKIIGNAVDTFVAKYYKDIEATLSAPSGVSFTVKGHTFTRTPPSSSFDYSYIGNLDAPSLIKVLDLSGAGTKPPHGLGNYEIRVYRKCDGETPPNCQINSLTYLTEPAKRAYSSSPDYAFAAIAAKTVGVFGGTSTIDRPQEFRFVDENMRPLPDAVPNPLGKPGLVAMRGGFLTHSLDVNVRRDGSRNITGDLDFQSGSTNQSIKGVKDIVGVGKLAMNELEIKSKASLKGPLHLSDDKGGNRQDIVGARNIEGDGMLTMKSLEVEGATVSGNATISGRLMAQSGATVRGTLRMERNDIEGANRVGANTLRSESGVIQLDGVKSEDEACSPGQIGRAANGKMLSCQNTSGRWTWQLASTVKYVTKVVEKEVERIVEKPSPIVMASWDYKYNRCNDYRMSGGYKTGYYGKVEGALFCSVVAKGWCDKTLFGSNERASAYNVDGNGRHVWDGTGTPYIWFANNYGTAICAFRSEEDARSAGFSTCHRVTNNCSMATDL
ncbi:hypothetical protein [Pandoraea communis]|uniref:hypothetical protein n=1 Tax=Pandoraea communis TaxID=2508297 RepID=UPI0025A630ED|nr:hypothetical protein [Pandoraea communis]MDM8354967.1 hypothetical protein [Pandoraea communis]